MKLSKLLLVVVVATLLLGGLVASAPANRLSWSSQNFRAAWARVDFTGELGTIECELTLEGSMNSSTMSKTAGGRVGYITSGGIPRCRRGGATILPETLPWGVEYSSFEGTLPNITGISTNFTGAAFRLREPTFGITCEIRATPRNPIGVIFKTLASSAIDLVRWAGATICVNFNINIQIGGGSQTINSNTGRTITVTLI